MREESKTYGLIGYPLEHSFSAGYFNALFRDGGIAACYRNFPLSEIGELPALLRAENIAGLNVTHPYKESVMPFLDFISPQAHAIGAVNCVRIYKGKLYGDNTDWYGFLGALTDFVDASGSGRKDLAPLEALVIGTGGSSKAVRYALEKAGIKYLTVSRKPGRGEVAYSELTAHMMEQHKLIVNTTPLGMFCEGESEWAKECAPIPYEFLSPRHYLFDLIYNPAQTPFLARGIAAGAHTRNGMDMLIGQAEKSWEIFTAAPLSANYIDLRT